MLVHLFGEILLANRILQMAACCVQTVFDITVPFPEQLISIRMTSYKRLDRDRLSHRMCLGPSNHVKAHPD